ncbi:unnamed protein product [Rotaria socialis]|uniref:D domain-containing protein n=1 Tax=Rotaria socialis TaxID=392032 RepID=A0A821QQU8_9BILA|nr:unnamed protein product [Rotaria socialis]
MSSSSTQNIDDILSVNITTTTKTPTIDYEGKSHEYLTTFLHWNSTEQSLFVEDLLKSMDSYQHGYINSFLSRMLRRDFIGQLSSCGLEHLAEKILEYLDEQSLQSVELVCREWYVMEKNNRTEFSPIHNGMIYRNIVKSNEFYRCLYHDIVRDIKQLTINWQAGKYQLEKIQCHSRHNKGVYCLQYDDQKIICGLRDNTIQIWNRKTLECVKILTGHNGSVLCLQYDDKVIITGSSDSTIRVWDIETGILINTLVYHAEAVLHLRFVDKIMMTCSKDRSIAVWEINSPADIVLHRALVGHRAAVNVVDFDDKYIVSASGDRTIKVWKAGTFDFVRTLIGHRRGIACLQYRDQLVVSGSSDNTIRIWNIECGTCLRILEGHEELVRCVRFDSKLIVSGAYDGKIKIWDLQAALDPRSQKSSLCMKTFTEHTGRVFRLQFDEFQIVSSSHDDTIICFNFLQPDISTSYIRHDSSDSTNVTSISNVDHTQVASSTTTVQSTQETLQRQNSNLSRSSSSADSETSKKLDII